MAKCALWPCGTVKAVPLVRPGNLVAIENLLEALAFHSDPAAVDVGKVVFQKRKGRSV